MQSQLDSSQQVEVLFFLNVFNKLYKNFRVRVRTECQPFGLQFLLEVCVVLNYAVVDYREVLGFRIMGVRIHC